MSDRFSKLRFYQSFQKTMAQANGDTPLSVSADPLKTT